MLLLFYYKAIRGKERVGSSNIGPCKPPQAQLLLADVVNQAFLLLRLPSICNICISLDTKITMTSYSIYLVYVKFNF